MKIAEKFRGITLAWSTILFLGLLVILPLPKAGMELGVLPVLYFAILLVILFDFLSKPRRANKWMKYWFLIFLWFVCLPFAQLSVEFLFGAARTQLDFHIPLKLFNSIQFSCYSLILFYVAWRVSSLKVKGLSVLVYLLVLMLLSQALLGLWQSITHSENVLNLWQKEIGLTNATGTFVNRNHYAGFLALLSPVLLSVFFTSSSLFLRSIPKYFKYGLGCLNISIIAFAIIASNSRMGFLVFLLGVSVWLIFGVKSYSPSKILIFTKNQLLLLVGIALVTVIIWFGVDDVLNRFLQLQNGSSRWDVWVALGVLPVESWLFGVGVGNFAESYELIKPAHFHQRFNYLHNDYLEFVIEFGLVLALISALLVGYCFWKLLPKMKLTGLRLGCVAAIAVTGIHSLVDFSLQIPAYGVYFAVVVGLLLNENLAASNVRNESSGKTQSNNRKKRSKRSVQGDEKPSKKKVRLSAIPN